MVTVEVESSEIWACQRGERLSTAAQGRCSPWLTSSLTLPMEPVEGWLGGWGTRLRLEAYLPPQDLLICSNCLRLLYKHEYPNFTFCLSRKESLNENLLPCFCNRVDSLACREELSICILLKIDEGGK